MKKNALFLLSMLFLALMLPSAGKAQDCEPLVPLKLKNMLIGLGYTVKDLNTEEGKEKFEVNIKTASFNVPIGYEISPSKNFVWLTANLGKAKDETSASHFALLKQNSKVQPCFFYITDKGNLMMGLAVENRGITPAILRRHTDKFSSDVSNTSAYWQ
ncbi:MAG: hypothetical protein U0T79_02690 [Ferruginibacter sp.]